MTWTIFRRTPKPQHKVTTGRFEIEQNGEVAYLEYSVGGNVLVLMHTEVPEKLRGMGLASSLAETAFRCARDNKFKVDVVCPLAQSYIAKHPEYSDLIVK